MSLTFQEIPIEIEHIPNSFIGHTENIPVLQEVDVPIEYLSIEEVEELLGRSERTIRRYVKDGYIKAEYKTVDGRRRVYYTNRSVLAVKILLDEDPNFFYFGKSVDWFCRKLLKLFFDYYIETMKSTEIETGNFTQFMQREFQTL